MKRVRIGYKLHGTVDLTLECGSESGEQLRGIALDALLTVPEFVLVRGIEGMPHGIEGDAIEVICVENPETGEEL